MTVEKALVTGAGGYIGRHVVNELLKEDLSVYANDLSLNDVPPGASAVLGDILTQSEEILEKAQFPDLVIHLAWKDGFVHDSNAHMDNLSEHYRFLTGVAESGCKNIAVMGSMHEVGYHEGVIDENTSCKPLSMYGIAKNALRESMFRYQELHNTFNLFWLRAYYLRGDDKYASNIFSKILKASEKGEKTFPFTSGKNQYDFITVQELARQIVKATTQDKICGIINVCSGKPVTLAEEVERFIVENSLDIKLEYGAYPDRKYDSPKIYGDAARIEKIMEKNR